MIAQVFRFAVIGLLATLVHAGVAIAVEASADVPPLWANFLGFSVAVLVSYFGHAHITLRLRPDHGSHFSAFFVGACRACLQQFRDMADCPGPAGLAVLGGDAVYGADGSQPSLLKLWVFRPAKRSEAHGDWPLAERSGGGRVSELFLGPDPQP
ncbi:MAG: GtrA family protein [Paracoccaceae bacterium]